FRSGRRRTAGEFPVLFRGDRQGALQETRDARRPVVSGGEAQPDHAWHVDVQRGGQGGGQRGRERRHDVRGQGNRTVIDPRAIVDPGARLAEDVTVGPYTIIGADVEIGAGTWIGPHVVINGPTRIGRDNKIYQFASIGECPQDKKYAGEPTRLEIGDRNVIREYATLNRGTV